MPARWTTPTVLDYVTSPFNLARRHPVTGTVIPHTGTDYRAPTGTAIRAAAAGTVVRSLRDDRAGNYVRVSHPDGTWTGYSHLSRRDVVVGQAVTVGQRVGLSGSTGLVTGAHLHFEVCVDGVKVDPVPFLERKVVPVSDPDDPTPDVPDVPVVTKPDPLEEDDPMPTPEQLWQHKVGPTPATSLPAWQQLVGAKNRATEARGFAEAAHDRADTAAARALRVMVDLGRVEATLNALAELTGVSLAELTAKVDAALAAAPPPEEELEPLPLPEELTP